MTHDKAVTPGISLVLVHWEATGCFLSVSQPTTEEGSKEQAGADGQCRTPVCRHALLSEAVRKFTALRGWMSPNMCKHFLKS